MYQVSLTQKRICSYTHYTHRAYFNIQDKSTLFTTLLTKYNRNNFNPWNFLITKIWNERRNKKIINNINNKTTFVIYEAIANKLRMSYPFYIIRVFINLLLFLLYPIIWGNFPIDIWVQWGNFPTKVTRPIIFMGEFSHWLFKGGESN